MVGRKPQLLAGDSREGVDERLARPVQLGVGEPRILLVVVVVKEHAFFELHAQMQRQNGLSMRLV